MCGAGAWNALTLYEPVTSTHVQNVVVTPNKLFPWKTNCPVPSPHTPAATLLLCLWIWPLQGRPVSRHLSFRDWPFSLSIMSGFIRVVTFHSFARLDTFLVYVYTTVYVFSRLLMDIWVVLTFWLVCIVQLWICVYRYLLEILLSILWAIYPGMELLGHTGTLFLIFGGNTIICHS